MLSASVSKPTGAFQGEIPSVFRTGTYHSNHHQGSLGPTRITLKLLSTGEEYPLRSLALPASVGRSVERMRPSARNGLFHSPYLSRHHAVIKVERGRVVVEDLGSSNGTFVNGVSLKAGEPWPLSDGDLIQFGSEDENACNAAIVAQVFFQDLTAGGKPLLSTLPLGDGDDDPFSDAASHGGLLSSLSAALNSTTTTTTMLESSGGEAVATKIASISRSLASLGISIRTAPSSSSQQHSTEGTLQILTSIEYLVQDLSRHFGSNPIASPGELSDCPTIHQRPSLPEAMNIINAYEGLFCLIALVFVLWMSL